MHISSLGRGTILNGERACFNLQVMIWPSTPLYETYTLEQLLLAKQQEEEDQEESRQPEKWIGGGLDEKKKR